jgi:peroxiredoxin
VPRVNFGMANLSQVTSWLSASFPDMRFKLPRDADIPPPGEMASVGGGPLSATLDKLCDLYGLSYRIDDTEVIVLEVAAAPAAPLMEKVYWLKPGSLPGDAPADKTLAGKGITFPTGATASWQAQAGQLAMRNTPENQARLAQLVASDFGGGIGTPTHWLELAGGGRIGLAVDKFGKDAITGWHPIYGRCSIPTADVASIRNYPLQPNAAMKAVENWHAVYAPEPVLPAPGGDDSALIGKAAGEFKLAQLEGGQFDLAAQKGKVVVLDFWATWCGPCVRSLPGLIQSMAGFSPDRVKFVGVNEDEPAAEVKQFLETRGWKLNVALDAGQTVGQKYGVDGIPHTFIIGPDGKIAWSKTGYSPDGEGDAAKEVNQLLAPPAPAGSAPKAQ